MSEPPDDELSEEALAIIRWQEENPDAWGDQDENGVDLARLRENLKLTPAERLKKLDAGRRTLQLIKDARNRQPIR
ncbi:MAG TPA: hypothetical protein VM490_26665 [Armatimonadaceae bacterium]|nr:hypothetical protein [Armatimonadaceae bacterium]